MSKFSMKIRKFGNTCGMVMGDLENRFPKRDWERCGGSVNKAGLYEKPTVKDFGEGNINAINTGPSHNPGNDAWRKRSARCRV